MDTYIHFSFVICSPAPSASPVSLGVTSTTSTSINIAWDRVPCLDRNADISRYLISYCLASDASCDAFQIVSFVDNAANRVLNITGLIPRTNYGIKIRADHINNLIGIILTGPFSDLLLADTDVIQGSVCMYVSIHVYI